MISWASLENKIKECYELHNECRNKVESHLPKGFRVIDVTKRCLVETTECRFVALSYVWGANLRPSLLAASSANIRRMKKEGGLPALEMPRTIEDAIKVCILLGQRYPWVDRLCVLQDDDDDKKDQIKAMNTIFSSAQLVLIAAYGDSMDFGIPGIGHLRRIVQHREDVLGLRITNVIRSVQNDPLDLWHTRAWTYQEAVLSTRRLYFTNACAFFECKRSTCHEDQFNPGIIRNKYNSTRVTIPEDDSNFKSFARHLRHYTSRKLTYRSDAYEAVNDIFESLYEGQSKFESGLPRSDFDRALLWFPRIGVTSTARPEIHFIALPTWSWSSIMGLSDEIFYRQTEFYGPFAHWYVIKGPFPPGSVEVVSVRPNSRMDDDWQIYMAIACSYGCVENVSVPFSLKVHSIYTMRDTFNTCWKGYDMPCKETILLAVQEAEYLKTKDRVDIQPEIIVTRCQTASLRLSASLSTSVVSITDLEGGRIGQLCGNAVSIREEITLPVYDKGTKFEFCALSLSGQRERDHVTPEFEAKKVIDVERNSFAKVPLVNVLMIGWEGSTGLAYRRALGWIYLIDWIRLRREWKMIMLR